MKLHLGCGMRHLPGWVNVDYNQACHPDMLVNLERPLPFLTDSVDEVFADEVIEHINNFFPLMAELHRIVRPDGRVVLRVPHVSFCFSYSDQTHVRHLTLHSFDVFLPDFAYNYYTPTRFKVSARLQFTGGRFRFLNFISWLINPNHVIRDIWERFCWVLPCESITFTLKPIK